MGVTEAASYTKKKNLIESKRSWPMRYLFAANEIIYLIQWYLLFEWLWNMVSMKYGNIESIKILFEPNKRVCLVKPLNSTSQNDTIT